MYGTDLTIFVVWEMWQFITQLAVVYCLNVVIYIYLLTLHTQILKLLIKFRF